VILDGGGRMLRVQSTRDAYLCLKNHWPLHEGSAKAVAVATCQAGLLVSTMPDAARQAFLDAAKEAGWHIRSWTAFEPASQIKAT